MRPGIETLFREPGLLPQQDGLERKRQFEELVFLFTRLCEDAPATGPGRRPPCRPQAGAAGPDQGTSPQD